MEMWEKEKQKKDKEGWMYYNNAGGPFYSKIAADRALIAMNRQNAILRRKNNYRLGMQRRKAAALARLKSNPIASAKGERQKLYNRIEDLGSVVYPFLHKLTIPQLQAHVVKIARIAASLKNPKFKSKRRTRSLEELSGA